MKKLIVSLLALGMFSSAFAQTQNISLRAGEEANIKCERGTELSYETRLNRQKETELNVYCKTTCEAYLKVDPYVVGIVGYNLFIKKTDGGVIKIQTDRIGKESLIAMIPGLRRQLVSEGICEDLKYVGI